MGRAFKSGPGKLKYTYHRFKRKFPPRNTSVTWLVEQSRALHSVGWRCCNRLSRSGRLGRDQLRRLDALYLYRRGILLVLHRRQDSVGNELLLDRLRITPTAVKTIYHFIRGRG